VKTTTLRSFAAAYSTGLQPSAKQVVPEAQQAANRSTTWSKDQRPKAQAMVGPRFEQTDIGLQVNTISFKADLRLSNT
jgi:NADH dehydrogenase (ubiquinone) Fe-S protein 6